MTQMPFKWWLAMSASFYFLGVMVGALVLAADSGLTAQEWVQRLDAPAPQLPNGWEIAANNLRVLALLGLGMISAGLVTLAVLFFNGLLLGATVVLAISAGRTGVLLTGIAPHAIPEIMAFLISGAADLWLAAHVIAGIRGKVPPPKILVRGWVKPQLISVFLILIAAAIEGKFSHA